MGGWFKWPQGDPQFSSLAHHQAGSEEESGFVQNWAQQLAGVASSGLWPPVCGQSMWSVLQLWQPVVAPLGVVQVLCREMEVTCPFSVKDVLQGKCGPHISIWVLQLWSAAHMPAMHTPGYTEQPKGDIQNIRQLWAASQAASQGVNQLRKSLWSLSEHSTGLACCNNSYPPKRGCKSGKYLKHWRNRDVGQRVPGAQLYLQREFLSSESKGAGWQLIHYPRVPSEEGVGLQHTHALLSSQSPEAEIAWGSGIWDWVSSGTLSL